MAVVFAAMPTTAEAITAQPADTRPADALHVALERDLGWDPADAAVHQAAETASVPVEKALRARLGDRFGGAWFDGGLKVGVVSPADAETVRAAGATPVTVAKSEKALADAKAALDRSGLDRSAATPDVHSWYVDPATNSVVVNARTTEAARAFAAEAGVTARAEVTDAPTPGVRHPGRRPVRHQRQHAVLRRLLRRQRRVRHGRALRRHRQPHARFQQRRPGHLRRLLLPGQRPRLGAHQRKLDAHPVREQPLRRQRRGRRVAG
ncbi:S1 family peptidase, partial [Saccharothrix sp. MB29]|nr:S1 family peptidase [Saccharothrix sp. MB29]